MKKGKIEISLSCHSTANVFLYGVDEKIIELFSMLDVWGSTERYDRREDGGIFFEVPVFVWENIYDFPMLKSNRVEIIKL